MVGGRKMAVHKSISTVLVATDGSKESVEAARYAAELLRLLKPRVVLLHVAPNPDLPSGTSVLTGDQEVGLQKVVWEGSVAILDRAREPFDRAGVPVEGLVRRGDPATEILALAKKERADLIVVAWRGAGGAERMILGSTSAGVLRSAHCPVLVVRKGAME
jgi:nucleotide-binding universal stress UspA family protein